MSDSYDDYRKQLLARIAFDADLPYPDFAKSLDRIHVGGIVRGNDIPFIVPRDDVLPRDVFERMSVKTPDPAVTKVAVSINVHKALLPYRAPHSGDMQTMVDDIDRVELTPASHIERIAAKARQMLKRHCETFVNLRTTRSVRGNTCL